MIGDVLVHCSTPDCSCPPSAEWLQAVQVLMVLSVVFSSVSFLVFLGQLFTMSKGGLFYFTGLCQVFAGNHSRKLMLSSKSV